MSGMFSCSSFIPNYYGVGTGEKTGAQEGATSAVTQSQGSSQLLADPDDFP